MEIHVKFYLISIFSFLFLVFKHDFIRCVDFTYIAASNTSTGWPLKVIDVKNSLGHTDI